jgi:hypothetical protein
MTTDSATIELDAAGKSAVAWLRDRHSPRLLLLTGPDQSGPTLLAAALTSVSEELPGEARIHAQASARGLPPRVLAWVLAAQLGHCAAEPVDLARLLAADRRPVTMLIAELDAAGPFQDGQGREAVLNELLRPLLGLSHVRLIVATGNPADLADDSTATVLAVEPDLDSDPGRDYDGTDPSQPEQPSQQQRQQPWLLDGVPLSSLQAEGRLPKLLTDPRILLTSSPLDLAVAAELAWPQLTAAARMQWTSFGQAIALADLTRPERAALWHAAAVATRDDALATALTPYLTDAPFTARWARWHPLEAPTGLGAGWTGPVLALAAGRGPGGDGHVLAADALGRIHTLDSATGRELGGHETQPQSNAALVGLDTGAVLAVNPDGAVTLLLHEPAAGADETNRIADLIAPDRSPTAHVRAAVTALREQATIPATALAAAPDGSVLALGDAAGSIHVFDLTSREFTAQLLQLHTGPVTAISAIRTSGTGELIVVSGARDGRVELITVAGQLGGGTFVQRATPVTALCAAESASGPVVASAWADGMILVHSLITHQQLAAVPLGWSPGSVLITTEGAILAGGLRGLLCLDSAG